MTRMMRWMTRRNRNEDVMKMNKLTRFMTIGTILILVIVGLIPALPAVSQGVSRGPVNNTDSEPNNDKANATVVDTDVTIQAGLIGSDHHDNYKFQLTKVVNTADKVTIAVVFDEALPLVSVHLRDSNGFLLDFMRDNANTDLYAVGTNASGWYYLNITDDVQTGVYYNVTLTFTQVTFEGDPNNNPPEAVVIPTLPFHINTTADGDTDPHDYQDFYQVMLSRTMTKADLLVAHMTQEITAQFWIEVFDATYKNVDAFVKESDSKPGSNQTYSYGADAPGNYYIRIWAANGSGSYDLTLDTVEINLDDDNDKPENATPIALVNNHTASFSGNVGEDLDIADYYSLEVMEGQVINASITSHDYNLSTRLPKMHMAFIQSDGGATYDLDPNITDAQLDPDGYSNGSAPEEGTNENYIKIFVDNVASGGGGYSVDLFTDRIPIVNQTLVQNITINESTADNPTTDTTIQLGKVFSDPDGNDILIFDYMIESDKGMDDISNFTVNIGDDADRTVTLTPRAGEVGGIGYLGSGDITFMATDPYDMNATATYHVKVYGTNHAPFLEYPYNETEEYDEPIVLVYTEGNMPEIELQTLFGDIDNDQLNFEVNASSPDIEDKKYQYSSVQDRYFLKGITVNETFIINFHLKTNLIDHKGPISIRLDDDSEKVQKAQDERTPLEEELWFWAIDDGLPQKESERVKLTIQATSPNGTPPKWSKSFSKISFNEDNYTVVDFDSVTSDIDAIDKKKREYTVANLSANITVEKLDRNLFKFSAKENWNGILKEVALNCTDSFGLYKTHSMDIEVLSLPDPPVKTGTTPAEDTNITIDESSSYQLQILYTDVDSGLADLDFNWSLDGTWLRTVVGDSYTYQSNYDDAGVHTIAVIVSERENPDLNISASWTITVINVNRPPTAAEIVEPVEGTKYTEGKLVNLRAGTSTDPDVEDSVTYTWKVDGVAISNDQTFETKGIKKGPHTITLEVSDGKVILTESVNITIKEAPAKVQGLGLQTIGMILLVLVILILVVMAVARGKKEKPVKDEVPDIYAADRKAMKEGVEKADKKEREEEEDEEEEEEED